MRNISEISVYGKDYDYLNDENSSADLTDSTKENFAEEKIAGENSFSEYSEKELDNLAYPEDEVDEEEEEEKEGPEEGYIYEDKEVIEEDEVTEEEEVTQEDHVTEDEFKSNNEDDIIEIGKRQLNDHLLYETFETSKVATSYPVNHTAVFYYIDSGFITYVKFLIYGSLIRENTASSENIPPIAEYSHVSENSLKAIITDFNAYSLTVQMMIYGYSPTELPQDYVPFMESSIENGTNESTQGGLESTRVLETSDYTNKLSALENGPMTSAATIHTQSNGIAEFFLLIAVLLQVIRMN